MDIVGVKQEYLDELQCQVTQLEAQIIELRGKNKYLETELDKCKIESTTDIILDYETEYRREHEQLINARKVIKYLSSLL